ncbi:uncharacterized protein J4E87_000983 [Alternaria ethzedia]|uniref:uncharacterized protein n=1 Tax=Alternaria ethzedia TaxID=181014 RepID=UPI0020C23726|nr:uncharacterized protein J4E87_000983 [Alternaria ethzedia]KAI4633817.1 hypothetical protein J4E87_000983 [Alternaria ethzedia]
MLVTAQIEELPRVADLVTMKQCSPTITNPESRVVDVRVRLGGRFLQRSRANHEDSVDIEHPVRVDQEANPKWKDGQLCWEAKGKCAQVYAEAKTKLLRELDQSQRESFCEICVSLFMVGKTPRKAKPMIIISSEDKRSREEAKRAITRSGVLADLGFEIGVLKYLPSGPTHPAAGSPSEACWDSASESEGWDSDTWKEKTPDPSFHPNTPVSSSAYYDSKQGLRITGMPIYVKTADGRSRMGTANVVHNGSKYGCITAAHIFGRLHQSPSSIDDDEDDLGIPFDSDSDSEDSEDDLNEKTSFAGALLSGSVRSRQSNVLHGDGFGLGGATGPSDLSEVSIDLPHGLALLGHLEPDQEPEKSLDCAIITIDDPGLQRTLDRTRVLKENNVSHMSSSTAEPKPSMATAWTTHGPIHGTLNKVPVLMRLPGSMSFQSVYTFVYEGEIKRGDCGSLVHDTTTRALYGMVIAAADRQPIAYIIAVKGLMNHVANAGWHLLDANDDYMHSSDIHDEAADIQTGHISSTAPLSIDNLESISSQPNKFQTATPEALSTATNNSQSVSLPTRIFGVEESLARTTQAVSGQAHLTGTSHLGQPQPEWSAQFGKYLVTLWNVQYGRYYWQHYIEVLFTEPAGANALTGLNPMADYNTSLSMVKYNEYVDTQIRRFIVTKRKREFFFAVPIFTYYGQATTKHGVAADEHAIAYSFGQQPQLVHGEAPLRKSPIPIVMEENNKALAYASRIFFAVHHPIQYNVKVKNLGHVHPDYLPTFLGYWNQENSDSRQDIDITADQGRVDEVQGHETQDPVDMY